MKIKNILLKALKFNTVVFSFIMAAFLIICNILYSFSFVKDGTFSREKAAQFLKYQSPAVKSAASSKNHKIGFFESGVQSLYIKSKENFTLHAVFKKSKNKSNKYIILCHGYSGDHMSMQNYAKNFYDMGFNILSPDMRAHGKSDGEIIGMGFWEKEDLLLWINRIIEIDSAAQIVLFGVSMGGATVLLTSGENNLPKNVKAIICDCAYTDAHEEIDYLIKNVTNIKSSFLTGGISFISLLRDGHTLKQADCVSAVKKSRTPTLFIHGSADSFVPFYMLNILYENAACPKDKMIVSGASHAQSMNKNPKEYFDKAEKFLDKYLT